MDAATPRSDLEVDLRAHLVCGEGMRTAPPFGFRGRGENKANELDLLGDNRRLPCLGLLGGRLCVPSFEALNLKKLVVTVKVFFSFAPLV